MHDDDLDARPNFGPQHYSGAGQPDHALRKDSTGSYIVANATPRLLEGRNSSQSERFWESGERTIKV